MQIIQAQFPRGNCPVYAFGPDDRSAPLVMFFPDAFGPRAASFAVAEEVAEEGWRVLMPDQFYEHIPYEPIEPKSIFEQGPKHDALMALFGSINQAKIDADVAAMIALAAERSDPQAPFGAIGYCMGGRYVLTAACASERVRFAGAFHSSNLAPAEGDSAHRRLGQAKGRIYIGVASNDPSYGAEEHGRLAQALRESDTDHVIETYHGASHGWVFPDIPIYNKACAGKHMQRMKEHMHEVFGE
jgi:carboxymethylenebutenolidase